MFRGVISREEWGARAPKDRSWLSQPFDGVGAHWEGPGLWDAIGIDPFDLAGHDRCYGIVQGIQAYHMDRGGYSDIAYNALACPHGYVFVGRWIGIYSAAFGSNYANQHVHAVCCVMGLGDTLTPDTVDALAWASWNFDVNAGTNGGRSCHRDWSSTMCPGDEICAAHTGGGPVPPPAPAPDVALGDRMLARGAAGGDVGEWQRLLNVHTGAGLEQDNVFGDLTYGATVAFQQWQFPGDPEQHDGIVGPMTLGAMWQLDAGVPAPPPAPVPAPPAAPTWPQWPGRYLAQPPIMRGDDVAAWQRQMANRGWAIDVDGAYGPDSDRVCRAFQAEKGLTVDGVVGPVTWDGAWTIPVS